MNHLITIAIMAAIAIYFWLVVVTEGVLLSATLVGFVVVLIYLTIYGSIKDYRGTRRKR